MADRRHDLDYDVIIIGAGISGINFAYRLQERNPELSYCIVESRHEIGGTWSLFKYPGIRSDSDLHTFGFPWRPWELAQPIAHGSAILQYLNESAAEYGIDKNIKYNHRVKRMSWSSDANAWTLDVLVDDDVKTALRSRFLLLGTGYYDYDEPLQAMIPGIENFKGPVVHPQFWPADLDYTDKNVVIIGSGATAITLLPSMTDKASHVTMLQRSPSYIISVPRNPPMDAWFRAMLPKSIAATVIRLRWVCMAFVITRLCRWFPRRAKRMFLERTAQQLPKGMKMDPHFVPSYNPWEQRMCVCPGGDFYQSLSAGKASIETGIIDAVTDRSINLKSGQQLNPDIIVTATGLKVLVAGGIEIVVDGKTVSVSDSFLWKGCMFENIPNLVWSTGYVNASWTLGADATAQLACRLLKRMSSTGYSVMVPRLSSQEKAGLTEVPLMNLKSTYIKKASGAFPKVGNSPQWMPRSHYFKDLLQAWWGDISSGMELMK